MFDPVQFRGAGLAWGGVRAGTVLRDGVKSSLYQSNQGGKGRYPLFRLEDVKPFTILQEGVSYAR